MGLTAEEKDRRKNDNHVKGIHITTWKSGQDYIFISYKSDDWAVVLHDIVYEMHKRYGLRVYFDRSFDDHNALWIEQFPENMESSRCKGVLAFIDNKYATSYATLLELMYSQLEATAEGGKKSSQGGIPVIPVNLETLTEIYDERGTGLGEETFEDGTKNLNAVAEKDLFDNAHLELKTRKVLTRYTYRGKFLTKRMCSKIVYELIQRLQVNENPYSKEMNMDSFYRSLKKTIEDAVGESVFGSVNEEPVPDGGMDEKQEDGSHIDLPPGPITPPSKKMKIAEMIEKGILHIGDEVYVQKHEDALGVIVGGNDIQYDGSIFSLNQYVKQVFSDNGSRNAYTYVYHKRTGKLLDDLRGGISRQAILEDGCMEQNTADIILEEKQEEGNRTTSQTDVESSGITAPVPLNLKKDSEITSPEKPYDGFKTDAVYQYQFQGETASIKILHTEEHKKAMQVDVILLAGSSIKKIWSGGSVDHRTDGGKKVPRAMYEKLLPGKTEEAGEGFLRVTEDIEIQGVSLSAVATMVSGASIAPGNAWKEVKS